MLDLFAGRLGWSKAFLERGWEVVAVDLVEPLDVPKGVEFVKADVLEIWHEKDAIWISVEPSRFHASPFRPDFICASPPCEQFSVHGMKHFHPNPPYPELGIKLFNHTRELCEASGVPYVIENVRAAQQFVGQAVHHCGPFYLWGTGVPAIMPQGVAKNKTMRALPGNLRIKILAEGKDLKTERNRYQQKREREAMDNDSPGGYRASWSGSEARKEATALSATIPPELSACVADYAERLLERGAPEGR